MSRLEDLMQTPMTRRHFLRTLGVGLMGVLGLPALFRMLDYQGGPSNNQIPHSSDGYGGSPYGGLTAPSDPHSFG